MLPTMPSLTYTVKLPFSKKEVKFRPWLVSEQKIIMFAVENGDENQIIDANKEVLQNCIKCDTDIDTLPIQDVEFLFLRIRAKSENEILELKYNCENIIDGEVCNNTINHALILTNIEIPNEKIPKRNIALSNNFAIKMKFPTYKIVKEYDISTVNGIIEIILDCVDCVSENETVYNDFSKDELRTFIESLSTKDFQKIYNFFIDLPQIEAEVEFVCRKCGAKKKFNLSGLDDFLD